MGTLQIHRQTQHDVGQGDQGGAHTHTYLGVPPLPGFLTEDSGRDFLPGAGVSGADDDPYQPPGSFFAPPCSGHTCNPGRG